MSSFIVSPRAIKDLKNISQHTSLKWGDEQRDRYIRDLTARFEWLSQNPKMGRSRPEIKQGYFSYRHGSHFIFYKYENEKIHIIGIPHQVMNLEKYPFQTAKKTNDKNDTKGEQS